MKRLGLLILIGSTMVMGVRLVWAAEPNTKDEPMTDEEVVVKTEGGTHRLMLPKDWPVEETPGLVRPAPIEIYLSMKFHQVKDAVTALDRRLDALEQRVTQLETDQKTAQKRLQQLEERVKQQEDANGHKTQER